MPIDEDAAGVAGANSTRNSIPETRRVGYCGGLCIVWTALDSGLRTFASSTTIQCLSDVFRDLSGSAIHH